MSAAAIVAARRTPIGTAGHGLAGIPAATLAAAAIRAVVADLEATGIDPARTVEVVLGNCMGPGGDLARVAALEAELPVTVPGLTVDRQCGSGLAALATGIALLDAAGSDDAVLLAGGVESASTAPWRFWPPAGDRPAERYERAPFAPAGLGDPEMGVAADLVAAEAGVGRGRQDVYAARSHARAVRTADRGGFDAELVAVAGLLRDERPRAGLTAERLARFRPAFGPHGTHTAGNSCGINDGAAVLAVVPDQLRSRLGLPGLRVLATATTAGDPVRPGLALVPAVRAALDRSGLGLDAMDVVELNEAFAGQVLACADALGLDERRVCPEGGAIALGHPWGASGAVLAVRLFSQLVRSPGGRYGLAGIAVGGGQGVAVVVEACR